jgi:hypothetical protein
LSLYAPRRHLPGVRATGGHSMTDLLYVVVALVTFALFALAVRGCERL